MCEDHLGLISFKANYAFNLLCIQHTVYETVNFKTREQNEFNTKQSHNTENVSCIDHACFKTALNGDIKSTIS